jgi:low temperature requirement protein LtrA
VPTPALLIVAAAVAPSPWATVLVVVALAIAYASPYLAGVAGWSVSPGHFAERYGLIIIIALGESMVSIGVGATAEAITWQVVTGVVLGVFILAAMWWMYFDVVSRVAARRLSEVTGLERNAMARDSYTYLHLPMVAGVVFAALGLKKAVGYIAGDQGHDWTDSLHGIPVWALHGGPALYLLSLVAFRLRIVRSLGRSRSLALVVLLASAPIGAHIGALMDLLLVTAIMAALIAWEAVRYAETRHRIRHLEDHRPSAPEQPAI